MTRNDQGREIGFWSGVGTLIFLCAGGAGIRVGLNYVTSSQAPLTRATFLTGTLLCAATVLWALARLLRAEAWAHYPAAAFLLVLLFVRGRYPIGAAELVPAVATFFLAPAGFLIWRFSATIRQADELQRHILFGSFAASFVVELVALMAGGVFDDAGWPRLHPIGWAGLLVATWSVALVWSNRRYGQT